MAVKVAYRIMALGVILSLLYFLQAFLESSEINQFLPFVAIFEGFVLAVFLAWFISKLNLKRGSAFIVIWLSLFLVSDFNNILEGYFFTKMYGSFEFLISANLLAFFIAFLQSTFAILLMHDKGKMTLTGAMKDYVHTRSKGSWVKRIVASSVVYFPIYFIFGMMISPFVMSTYSQPSSGVLVPSFTVIVPLELLRGFIYTIVLLVVFFSVKGTKKLNFTVAATLLYIPGAFLPIAPSLVIPSIMSAVAPFHMVEILADSVVYGYAVARLLSAKESYTV